MDDMRDPRNCLQAVLESLFYAQSSLGSRMASWFRAPALQAGKIERVSSPWLTSHMTLDA